MMNRVFVLVYSIVIAGSLSAYGIEEAVRLRDMYYAANDDAGAARDFFRYTSEIAGKGPTALGYNGVAEMMMCKHVLNPYTKLKLFYSGRDKLERAIATAPANVELRYLRYCIQQNVPGILNYSKNIEQDEQILLRFVIDPRNLEKQGDLFGRIQAYLRDASVLSEE